MALQVQIGMDEVLSLIRDDEKQTYDEFCQKFEPKKTSDDCYTPAPVFDAIAEWAAKEYGFPLSAAVRPFWPGADYKSAVYPDGCVVVDNPPFSILSEIVDFYQSRKIGFFLFGPSLTLTAYARKGATVIVTDADIVYENKAKIKTGFLTNLDAENIIRTAPDLNAAIKKAVEAYTQENRRELPKYCFPDCVVSSATLQRIAKYVDFRVPKAEAVFIRHLDSMKETGKAIFGGGLLISERAAAERAAAERAAAERAAAERAAAERAAAHKWHLSDRERQIQNQLGG